MDKPNIISYNTYRRIAKTHAINDKTITGKPITYNKLKHRVDNYMNKQKPKQTEPFKALLMSYMNGEIDYAELMSNLINK
jgi:hypothetical protein